MNKEIQLKYEKIKSIIESCRTKQQLLNTRCLVINFPDWCRYDLNKERNETILYYAGMLVGIAQGVSIGLKMDKSKL